MEDDQTTSKVTQATAFHHALLDHDLRQRIHDVKGFIAQELGQGEAELLEELLEHSQLALGGGLLQLSDGNGRVLFRSGRLKSTR